MQVDPAYHLLLEHGINGPYHADELRDLICRGRIRGDDTLTEVDSQARCLVRDVIPEADALAKTSKTSDRIVRKSSDRQQAVSEANARKRTSDRQPVAESVLRMAAITDGERRATTETQAVVVNPTKRSDTYATPPPKRRPIGLHVAIFLLLAVISALVWGLDVFGPDTTPFPTITFSALTAEELANLPETQLLARLEQESVRRLMLNGKDFKVDAAVLSPPARHLWHVMQGESAIRNLGLQERLRIERDPALANVPPLLVPMVESYRAMGLPAPAEILARALGPQNGSSADFAKLDKEFLASINDAQLVTYAEAHRKEFFPDLEPHAAGQPP